MKELKNFNYPERVLLTEVLPYEMPLLFDNNHFYELMKDDKAEALFRNQFTEVAKNQWTIPFDYTVRRNGGSKNRKLSIIHPLTQLDIVEFYKKYDTTMLYHCKKSPFSLRHIDEIAKTVFVQDEQSEHKNEAIENDPNAVELADDKVEEFFRSYFIYKKVDMAYRHFNSMDYMRLEQKYPYMMTLDVASCFYHIYTHSIAWAVKGKEAAKNNLGGKAKNFEQDFDSLMEHCNYNETNGIVVGPEVSRIFAEIILQRIDNDVIQSMKEKGRELGKDYEVRRYVDDHYIYATDKRIIEECRALYSDYLQKYKLFINESKTHIFERPFTTNISLARQHLSDVFGEWREFFFKQKDGKYENLKYPDKSLAVIIRKFNATAKEYDLQYSDINRYELSIFRNFIMQDLLPSIEKESSSVPTDIIILLAEFCFYCYSMDMCSTATFRMCQIIQLLYEVASKSADSDATRLLMDKYNREIKRCLDIYSAKEYACNTNLEVLNLLLSAQVYSDYELREDRLINIFGIKDGYHNLNYFQICVLFHIIKDKSEYANIRNNLISYVIAKFKNDEIKSQKSSEMTLLYFDMMTCPYLSKSDKIEIVKAYRNISDSGIAGKTRKEIENCGIWFFDWSAGMDLSEFLRKKQYHQAYE